MTKTRITKYTQPVLDFVNQRGHATNAQILAALKPTFPEISATTVHRITARMVLRLELIEAPVANNKAARFDSNVRPHDHFNCLACDRLRDIIIPRDFLEVIENQLGKCRLSGNISVQGQCSKCII